MPNRLFLKDLTCSLLATVLIAQTGTPQNRHSLSSPDKRVKVELQVEKVLSYSISLRDDIILPPSAIALRIEGKPELSGPLRVRDTKRKSVSETIRPVVPEKRSIVDDTYEFLEVTFEGGIGVQFRAYNDGVAYRFVTSLKGEVIVTDEELTWNFSAGDSILFPEEESLMSHYERLYSNLDAGGISDSQFCSLPALVKKPGGVRLLLTEADISDYPGMFLRGTGLGSRALKGWFPAYPLEEQAKNDRDVFVTKEADYIARTAGSRAFPWRVVGIAENDGELILNDIVYRLGRPLMLKETDWIRPGKVAWDWWNANNVYGVSFRSGINTGTYKYYIDFASKYGIEYIILDEGWTDPADLSKVNTDLDARELFAYAKGRGVGIIPWVLWNSLEADMGMYLDQFAEWGAKGVKVDFMQRHDQRMVNYYWRVAEEAAKRKLLVDFHGAYKPDGLRRAYPNVISREGVRGAEWNKWSKHITPGHNLTIPFIRMAAGPMDYTPGATINANADDFRDVFTRPMSQGTRCHQLAMYVVYESPLQMLCDNPSNYMREPEMMEFLSAVPTVWHDTKVLEARVGEYVLVARRNGDAWYLGGMTDWTARAFDVDLGFLPEGSYSARVWQDGPNAHRFGNDFQMRTTEVKQGSRLRAELRPGGGWVAVIKKK